MNTRQLLEAIIRGTGLDAKANAEGRDLLRGMFAKSARKVAAKVKKTGDASIREILLHTCAHGTQPEFGGTVGDLLRDRYESRVVKLAAPQIEESTSEPERIRIVQECLLEVLTR